MPQLYRVDLLQRALASLCKSLESARAAVIVSVEGFVIASYPPGDESFLEDDAASSSHVAAMASIMVALAERTLSRLRLSDGEIDRLLVEGKHGSLIVLPVSSEAAIAVLLEKEAKMGVALRTVPRAAQQVRDILERKAA
jgi:predicted regulator of Ras-like GTPase activity (Roadblock/LC7/MglB family)